MFNDITATMTNGALDVTFDIAAQWSPSQILAEVKYGTSHSLIGIELHQRAFSVEVPDIDADYSVTLQGLENGQWVYSDEVPVLL